MIENLGIKIIFRYILNIFFLLFLTSGCSQVVDNNKLLGDDFNLFEVTPIWDLAKAAQNEDTSRMRQLLIKDYVNIDFQEPKYGKTLLMLAVINQNYNACKILLEHGANPNKHDNYSGTSPIIYSAGIKNGDVSSKFLKLLLEHKGDPNDEETGKKREGDDTRETPLLMACSDSKEINSPLHKVQILVEAGANINHINEFNDFPLKEALLYKHLDVVLFLLQKGVEYDKIIIDRSQFSEKGEKVYISNILREMLLPLDSKQYQVKMRIVDFLNQKGLKYKEAPIPEYIIKEVQKNYPNNWKEYLSKY